MWAGRGRYAGSLYRETGAARVAKGFPKAFAHAPGSVPRVRLRGPVCNPHVPWGGKKGRPGAVEGKAQHWEAAAAAGWSTTPRLTVNFIPAVLKLLFLFLFLVSVSQILGNLLLPIRCNLRITLLIVGMFNLNLIFA